MKGYRSGEMGESEICEKYHGNFGRYSHSRTGQTDDRQISKRHNSVMMQVTKASPYETGSFLSLDVSHIMHIIGGADMVSMTLAVPQELKSEMDKHPEMNWSEVARQAIKDRIELLKKWDKMLEKSKMTEKDAIELGRLVRRGIGKRIMEEWKCKR